MAATLVLSCEGQHHPILLPDSLTDHAERWSYVLRNRYRWVTDSGGRRKQDERAAVTLTRLGFDDEALAFLSACPIVTLQFDQAVLAVAGAAEMPWEYLLSAATRQRRQGRALIVVRRVAMKRPKPAEQRRQDATLIVESAPGVLRSHFSFEEETALVTAALSGSGPRPRRIADPTLQELTSAVTEIQPSVLHLAGLDAHQGTRMLNPADRALEDGIIIAGSPGASQIAVASARDVATAVTSAEFPPDLVAVNFYNTGQAVTRLMVEHGAGAALGYFDEFDDSVAEVFVAAFYQHWRKTGGDAIGALDHGLTVLRNRAVHLDGTGIVLWIGADTGHADTPRAAVRSTAEQVAAQPPPAPPDTPLDISIDARVCPGLNYALLWNNKDLFVTFRVRNLATPPPGGIRIEVTLRTGQGEFPYFGVHKIDEPVRELREKIRIPLPRIADGLRENMPAVIHVRVSAGPTILYESTDRVTMHSVDEWQLDDRGIPWLPAFVLPRDPAIGDILDRATRYIRVLNPDAREAFVGYQEGTGGKVDAQVRSIWAAIAFDIAPTYIGALPGVGTAVQRLRSPGQTVRAGRGTCLDLAMLFAACLEHVELRPVIFLGSGHAWAGYWTDLRAYDSFCQAQLPDGATSPRAIPVSTTPWVLNDDTRTEVEGYLSSGALVQLETVFLTQQTSLEQARDRFGANMTQRPPNRTHMVDLSLARRHGVDSLPPYGDV